MTFPSRARWAAFAAGLFFAVPFLAGDPARAGDLAIAPTCVARVGLPVDCLVREGGEAPGATTAATALPPGLELTGDGRIAGTPTQAGISNVSLTVDGEASVTVPVVVSDVDYLAVTLSSDGKTLRGTRWDGSHAILHQGLFGSDVRGLGIHPNGSVYLLTVRTLLRVERPGQVTVVLDGLEAEAMDIAPDGQIHIASRTEVLSLQPSGAVFHRARGQKVWDVLEDDAGDMWTIEFESGARRVRHIEVRTGESHVHAAGVDPISIAADRGRVFVSTAPSWSEPTRVVAIDHDGTETTLLDERHLRVEYSDAFGLLATDVKVSSQIAWGSPLRRTQLADPTFHRVAVAEHLRFTE